MPVIRDIQHSILVVSGAEKFDALIRHALHPGSFQSTEFLHSAAAARRSILERYYNIVVINVPLPDEQGVELAIDTACKLPEASVFITVPADRYGDILERVTDHGIMVMSKPFPQLQLRYAIRLLCAQQVQIRKLERRIASVEEKMEELRIVSKAKCLLIEKRRLSEDEAHRLVGKTAMDHGLTRARAAEMLIEELEQE